MKKLIVLLVLSIFSFFAFSQESVADSTPSVDMEVARSRIQVDRTRTERQYGTDEIACYSQFAVADCLREARVRQRAALADLRRQELAISDAERKRKSLAQIERLQEKTSAQQLEHEAARRRNAREALQEK